MISNVNINHGNSGGPLINLAGQVIGLTTFLDPGTPNGPGISGIVSIRRAAKVIATGTVLVPTLTKPSAELLPTVPATLIPSDELEAAAKKTMRPEELKAPHNFITTVYTPFVRESRDHELDREFAKARNHRVSKRGKDADKEEYDFGAHYAFWDRFNHLTRDAVVSIEVVPVPRETSGSMWGSLFGAMGGFRTHHKFEFRDDFYDMELYRGGVLVQPISRFRQPAGIFYEDINVEMKDKAFGGIYFYDPAAFEPGAEIVLKVRRESNLSKWDEVHIDKGHQKRIWDEFAAYRASTSSGQ